MPELDLGNVKGPQGKSAYQSALDAGYSGSEEAFNTAMAKAPDAVLYTAQSLTDVQKVQARGNINAASDDYLNSNKQNGVAAYGKVEGVGWYRIANGSTYAGGILSLYHSYYNGGPTSLKFLVTMDTGIPEIKCIDYPTSPLGYVMPIENVRLVQGTDGYDLHIDIFYKLVGSNSLFINFMNMGKMPASVQKPVFVAENDVLPEGETLIATMEFQNPPMKLGVEYRTTERYLGKPVYVKTINMGNLPGNAVKQSSFQSNNVVDKIVSVTGQCTSDSGINMSLPYHAGSGPNWNTVILIGATGVGTAQIVTFAEDFAGYTDACITVKYTKLAD